MWPEVSLHSQNPDTQRLLEPVQAIKLEAKAQTAAGEQVPLPAM